MLSASTTSAVYETSSGGVPSWLRATPFFCGPDSPNEISLPRAISGGIWLTGVTGSLAYQWTKPIPTSLKIIHSRVYAQGITLGALALTAAIETYHHTSKEE